MRIFFPARIVICVVAALLGGVEFGRAQTAPAASGPECIAVVSAFGPELEAIETMMVPDAGKFETTRINGVEFKAAEIGGRRFVFFLNA